MFLVATYISIEGAPQALRFAFLYSLHFSPSILFAAFLSPPPPIAAQFGLKWIYFSFLLQFIRSQRCGHRQQDRASDGEFFL